MSLFAFQLTSLIAAVDNPVSMVWWLLFGLLTVLALAIDLLALHGRARDPSMAESAVTVAIWCLLALGFNGFVWWLLGGAAGVQFATGYLLEWSMSMDNVFVFAVIFRFFHVPKQHQYRILFWGIVGAVAMRLAFILAGTALIARFEFILPLLGLFLIYTGYRLVRHSGAQIDPSRTLVLRLARRWLPLAEESKALDGSGPEGAIKYSGRFFVREHGRLRITSLFVVLLIVESTDLLFAVDSIPAIFGITTNAFIVFTSNIFAILGLRALYFLLAGFIDSFRYLHYGLAAVLAFVGLKMVAEGWLPHGTLAKYLPPWASLLVIVGLLGGAILASVLVKQKETEH